MAVSSVQLAVGTAPVELTAVDSDGNHAQSVLMTNVGAAAVFLGGAGVTTTNGYSLAAGASLSVDLTGDEKMFAVAAVSGSLHVLRTGA